MTNKETKITTEECLLVQRWDSEVAGCEALIREFSRPGEPAIDPVLYSVLVEKLLTAQVGLKRSQLAVFKAHSEIPTEASINFNFRDEIVTWNE